MREGGVPGIPKTDAQMGGSLNEIEIESFV